MEPDPVLDHTGRATIVMDNGDGSLIVRVAKGHGDGSDGTEPVYHEVRPDRPALPRPSGSGGDWITLPETTALQHYQIKRLARQADEAMPPIDPIENIEDQDAVLRQAQQVDARTELRDSPESPYAAAFIEIVRLLTGRQLTFDELHVQAKYPGTINAMLKVWETPLAGPAPTMMRTTAVASAVTEPVSILNGHGSPAGIDTADPSHLPS